MKTHGNTRTMSGKASADIFRKAAENRDLPTKSESLLWQHLKGKSMGCRMRRQHPIDRFIVDFYCHAAQLVIEIDGGYHMVPEQKEYDNSRSHRLEELGCVVIRFTNQEVLNDLNEVLSEIRSSIARRISPLGVGGSVAIDEKLVDPEDAQRYLLVSLYWEQGREEEAMTLLADVPDSKTLDYRKDEEHAGYLTCYTILQELSAAGSSSLTNNQEAQLMGIAEKESNQAAAMAQIMLFQYADFDYAEVLVKPETDRSMSGGTHYRFRPTKAQLSVFPNPANDHITLLNVPVETVMIDILDAQGRRKNNFLSKHTTNQVLRISDLEAGAYQVRCMSKEGAEIESTLLIVE